MAFCTSSVITMISAVARSASSTPRSPTRLIRIGVSTVATSFMIGRIRSTTSSRLTSSSTDIDSASCTSAIDDTRRTDSINASRPSALLVRRACSRSSAATVCRLFFTRWWISRMVASLDSSARSRRLTSVTSRISTAAPTALPCTTKAACAAARPRPRRRPPCACSTRRPASRGHVGQLLRLERVADQRPGDGDQVVALEFGRQAHPVIGRDRVGAGEGDLAGLVEADEPVADAGART